MSARWVLRMSIVNGPNMKKRKGVLERQAPGAPVGLLMMLGASSLPMISFLGYTYWRYSTINQIDPVIYLTLFVPVVLSYFLYRSQRRSLAQIASVSEAVEIAASGDTAPMELVVAERGGGPARAWNTIVKTYLGESVAENVSTNTGSSDAAIFAMAAMNSFMLAVCGVDRAGRVIVANTAAGTYFERESHLLLGAELSTLLSEEARVAFDDVMQGRVQRRNGVDIIRKDEEGQREEILRLTVIPTRERHDVYVVITIEDVTRQRMAERSRHEFLAQATHELRTPLTNIRLYVEEAIEAGDDDARMRAEALNVISQESLRLERLVSELLDISELEAGARVMDKGDIRVDQLMEQLRADYEALAESKKLTLQFELPPKMPVLQGDRDKVAGALHNLLGNAMKYTPEGGHVTVRVDDEEGVLRFVFTDTGIGIGPDEQERVYDKFFRSSDERVSTIEGTGLGLAFAHQVAQKHGGDLTLESELNRGSTFTFSMPKPKLAA